MNDKLRETLNKIKILCEQNHEFAEELRKMVIKPTSAVAVFNNKEISEDTKAIRKALEISADESIAYDFIQHERLRDQLTIDNLRMENALLNYKPSFTEEERYNSFCVSAFYQVEAVINLYFHATYKDIKEMTEVIAFATKEEPYEGFRYTITGKEQYVTDIAIAHKINAICRLLMPEEIILKVMLGELRGIRNAGVHRGQSTNNEKFLAFYKKYSVGMIRVSLQKLVSVISVNIGKPISKWYNGVIAAKLPSSAFVKYEEMTVQLPNNLYPKIKDAQQGDEIFLLVFNNIIKDIELKAHTTNQPYIIASF